MDIRDRTRADIDALGEAVRNTGQAAAALRLAELLESETDSRDAATLNRELRATMGELRAMAALKPAEGDTVDDLSERRARRQSAS